MTPTKTISKESKGKSLSGTVVKTAMKDTITVLVQSFVLHPKYKKYFKTSKQYLVHDAGNTAKVGDKVVISETRPISKLKRFALTSITSSAPASVN